MTFLIQWKFRKKNFSGFAQFIKMSNLFGKKNSVFAKILKSEKSQGPLRKLIEFGRFRKRYLLLFNFLNFWWEWEEKVWDDCSLLIWEHWYTIIRKFDGIGRIILFSDDFFSLQLRIFLKFPHFLKKNHFHRHFSIDILRFLCNDIYKTVVH